MTFAGCPSAVVPQSRIHDFGININAISQQLVICGSTFSFRALPKYNSWPDKECEEDRPKLDVAATACLLHKCANSKDLSQGKDIHDQMSECGLQQNRFLGNLLIRMYGKCGALTDARAVFDTLHRRNHFTWNMMIGAYIEQGHVKEASLLFEKMPDPDIVSYNSMISAFAQDGQLKEALNLFEKMPYRDVVSWNSVIMAYSKEGQVEKAWDIFQRMPLRNIISWTAMITAYAQEGEVKQALRLFIQMPLRNLTSWNIMISACAQQGYVNEALGLFQQMPERDNVSWNVMIQGYAQAGQLSYTLALFEQMPQPDVISWTTMIVAYSQDGQLDKCIDLFEKIPQRDVVSYNAMIGCYGQYGLVNKAIQIFRQMQREGIRPNKITFISIFDACATGAALDRGKEMHVYLHGTAFESDVTVGSSLINMYAKCGCLRAAKAVFEQLCHLDMVLWSCMLAAYAQHGRCKEALDIFKQIQLHGMKPDSITFCSLLFACIHDCLVNEGCHYIISTSHHAVLELEVYNGMADLLGRAGLLDEAESLIMNMPMEPNGTTWTGLLGSCKMHADMRRGKHAAECAFKSIPYDSAPYVLLSNMYTAAGFLTLGSYDSQ